MRQGQGSGGAGAGPTGDELECLVGDIVITCHEIDSRVKKCIGVRQEWIDRVYPRTGMYAARGMRSVDARRQKSTYPDPQDPSDARFRGRDRLMSMWREMRRENPGTITDTDFAVRVRTSCKYRNSVAHAGRTRGNAVIRNDREHATYGVAELVERLGYIRETLAYVEQLYSHLGRIPRE